MLNVAFVQCYVGSLVLWRFAHIMMTMIKMSYMWAFTLWNTQRTHSEWITLVGLPLQNTYTFLELERGYDDDNSESVLILLKGLNIIIVHVTVSSVLKLRIKWLRVKCFHAKACFWIKLHFRTWMYECYICTLHTLLLCTSLTAYN